ncbi:MULTISPECIES: hypothetical protein [Nonomuraea]|uniref:Integral membrane protein n=1 Tax=Nonomuraea salmonea TaxID=46181 RepID=A0ABV5NVE2_9ACTN
MNEQSPTAGGRTFLRIAVAVQTVALFFQAITAGVLLASSHESELHHIGSYVTYGTTVLYLLAAVLAWRPGGGGPRPILYAAGFLVLASVQVASGIAGLTPLHVPLGVLMFALSTLALARLFPTRSASAVSPR